MPATTAREGDGESPLARAITPKLLLLFIVGDILGGGIYALVGEVGAETGGAIWSAFILALVMAAFTAGSYAELVSKYPHAGGAALYVHRAFKNRFFSFIIAFAVIMSGVTSASALARGFGGDYLARVRRHQGGARRAAAARRDHADQPARISESVKLNVGFTLVEIGGLLLIVLIAVVAIVEGDAEPGRAFEFKEGSSVLGAMLAGAALAFYALVGFEDSVNVAEETQDPVRTYPKVLFTGLAIAGVLYFLVTVGASAVVPTGDLSASSGPLLEVVQQGPLGIPEKVFSAIGLLALANGALINMIMASRLLYGMARERVVPSQLGAVWQRAAHALGRDPGDDRDRGRADPRGEPREARRHHGGPARDRVRGRQRERALPAPRPGRPRALPRAERVPGARSGRVDRAADRDRGRGLRPGRDPGRDRGRAVAGQRGGAAPGARHSRSRSPSGPITSTPALAEALASRAGRALPGARGHRVRADGLERELGAGDEIEIPRETVHQMWNPGTPRRG